MTRFHLISANLNTFPNINSWIIVWSFITNCLMIEIWIFLIVLLIILLLVFLFPLFSFQIILSRFLSIFNCALRLWKSFFFLIKLVYTIIILRRLFYNNSLSESWVFWLFLILCLSLNRRENLLSKISRRNALWQVKVYTRLSLWYLINSIS